MEPGNFVKTAQNVEFIKNLSEYKREKIAFPGVVYIM